MTTYQSNHSSYNCPDATTVIRDSELVDASWWLPSATALRIFARCDRTAVIEYLTVIS
jgi:hypothetical protein